MKKYPVLYACCILVKGVSRSMICDTQRHDYQLIPNILFEILSNSNRQTVEEIQATYPDYSDIIDEYFDFLYKKEFIFFTNTPEMFPAIEMRWEEPYIINNAIIDIGEIEINWGQIITDLEDLGCKHLQIRSFESKSLHFFEKILVLFDKKRILSLELVIQYTPELEVRSLAALCEKYWRIFTIHIHSAPITEKNYSSYNMGHVYFIQDKLVNSKHCGLILQSYFSINIKTFTESQKHNTCLNRKISIDSEGYIRNCPSMKEHYGNIRDATLQQALEHPDFKKYWTVHKDQINICKDCEFRYICTDCRAYVEDPQDRYSKPLKCGYNPYTCEWEEWSTNPLKQKAIDYYNLRPIL